MKLIHGNHRILIACDPETMYGLAFVGCDPAFNFDTWLSDDDSGAEYLSKLLGILITKVCLIENGNVHLNTYNGKLLHEHGVVDYIGPIRIK